MGKAKTKKGVGPQPGLWNGKPNKLLGLSGLGGAPTEQEIDEVAYVFERVLVRTIMHCLQDPGFVGMVKLVQSFQTL